MKQQQILTQRQTLKQEQRLAMRQIQQAKLIQLPLQDLITELKQEIEENPVLEFEENVQDGDNLDSNNDDYDFEEKFDSSDIDWNEYYENNFDVVPTNYSSSVDSENASYETFVADKKSFLEYLEEQILVSDYSSKKQLTICKNILGNIDEAGYFKIDSYDDGIKDDENFYYTVLPDDPVIELERNLKYKRDDIRDALYHVQDVLEPVGIGARWLSESLYIQYNKYPGIIDDPDIVEDIILNFLDHVARKKDDFIMKKMNITKEQYESALEIIRSFDPKPGYQYSTEVTDYIVPDVFVKKLENGKFEVIVNKAGIPNFVINKNYIDIIEKRKKVDKQTELFVKKKVERANYLKEALVFRESALKLVTEAILEYQREFFDTMDKKFLKPLILEDIARVVNLNISTVSRATNGRYMEYNGKLFELKMFFSKKIKGEFNSETSAIATQEYIKEIIDREDKKKPLSDEKISKLLLDKYGIKIARRTVQKYREILGIPKASQRKVR